MNHDVETNKNSKYSHKEWKEKGVGVGAGVGGEEKASDNTRGEMVETGRTNSNSDTDDTTTTITATVGTISTSLEGTSLEGTRLEETSQATQATTIPATQAQATTTSIQKTTLWMGELEYWMDEGFLVEKWWELLGEKLPFLKLKLIRDRFTGYSMGYCFVDFGNHEIAAKCLDTLNGHLIPGTLTKLRLNWASGGGNGVFSGGNPSLYSYKPGPEYSIFVGDLDNSTTDAALFSLFTQHLNPDGSPAFPSVRSAKVVWDASRGCSRGYGFVRFGEEEEQQRALIEMNGKLCGSRPIRVSVATPKNRLQPHQLAYSHMASLYPVYQQQSHLQHQQPLLQDYSATTSTSGGGGGVAPTSPTPSHHSSTFDQMQNTTVFVGGLYAHVTEQELSSHFARFGEIAYVKIPPNMNCGFVSFVFRSSAESAIQQMSGAQIGGHTIRLSWGNSHVPMYAPVAPFYYTPHHPHPYPHSHSQQYVGGGGYYYGPPPPPLTQNQILGNPGSGIQEHPHSRPDQDDEQEDDLDKQEDTEDQQQKEEDEGVFENVEDSGMTFATSPLQKLDTQTKTQTQTQTSSSSSEKGKKKGKARNRVG